MLVLSFHTVQLLLSRLSGHEVSLQNSGRHVIGRFGEKHLSCLFLSDGAQVRDYTGACESRHGVDSHESDTPP